VKQGNVQRELYLSNCLIDCDRVSFNKTTVDVSPVQIHEHRILCVDDDVLGTTMRAEILREHGFSVVVFHSPFEVTRCDLSTFNLAILDFEMPGLNGRELLLRIRAMGARFPIVLLTGCLGVLSHEDCVLFARCIFRSAPLLASSSSLSQTVTCLIPMGERPQATRLTIWRRRSKSRSLSEPRS
jgi:CheY-like chemotaxis protein